MASPAEAPSRALEPLPNVNILERVGDAGETREPSRGNGERAVAGAESEVVPARRLEQRGEPGWEGPLAGPMAGESDLDAPPGEFPSVTREEQSLASPLQPPIETPLDESLDGRLPSGRDAGRERDAVPPAVDGDGEYPVIEALLRDRRVAKVDRRRPGQDRRGTEGDRRRNLADLGLDEGGVNSRVARDSRPPVARPIGRALVLLAVGAAIAWLWLNLRSSRTGQDATQSKAEPATSAESMPPPPSSQGATEPSSTGRPPGDQRAHPPAHGDAQQAEATPDALGQRSIPPLPHDTPDAKTQPMLPPEATSATPVQLDEHSRNVEVSPPRASVPTPPPSRPHPVTPPSSPSPVLSARGPPLRSARVSSGAIRTAATPSLERGTDARRTGGGGRTPLPANTEPQAEGQRRDVLSDAATARGPRDADWMRVNWGMDASAVMRALAPMVVPVHERSTGGEDGLAVEALLPSALLGPDEFAAKFLFDRDGLTAIELRGPPRAGGAFDEMVEWLSARHGEPARRDRPTSPGALLVASWLTRDGSIELRGREADLPAAHVVQLDLYTGREERLDSDLVIIYRRAPSAG